MSYKFIGKSCALGLAVLGIVFIVSGLKTPVKAYMSEVLIEKAWEKTLQGQSDTRPWPWMDSVPVAKLYIPKYDKSHVVMSGVSGAVMAFAPGWHEGSERPGVPGVSLISAHKDMHFSYLKDMVVGDVIYLTTAQGEKKTYRVEDLKILDRPSLNIQNQSQGSVVVLSTCYPFSNWQVGGGMRFVVISREVVNEGALRIAGL